MGIISCKYHGEADIVEVCPHVAREIDNKRYEQFHNAGSMLVCETCFHKYHLEDFENCSLDSFLNNDERLETFFNIYEQIQEKTVWCSECLSMAKVEQARKDNKQDPFPIYDRTLNSHCIEILTDLHKFLVTNYEFHKSTIDDKPAVTISPGAYTYPLTVTIYYVTKETEQNKIIQLIDNFLRVQKLNQVKIEFYEAEVWNTWTNSEKGVSGRSKGFEKLLREVFVNC
jgi:hypothetical protein